MLLRFVHYILYMQQILYDMYFISIILALDVLLYGKKGRPSYSTVYIFVYYCISKIMTFLRKQSTVAVEKGTVY